MSDSARETFVDGIDPRRAPVVLALDRAILDAEARFDIAIKYRMLTYALSGDFRRWICAIDAHPRKAVALRFLYGVLLEDPGKLFRGAPTSPLRTIDCASLDDVDAQRITSYVNEAVSKFDDFKVYERERSGAN